MELTDVVNQITQGGARRKIKQDKAQKLTAAIHASKAKCTNKHGNKCMNEWVDECICEYISKWES